MITFHELTIKNFLSYGNVPTIVDLNKNNVILISGQNGTGKTTLINAIYYAVYDESLTECNLDDLINNINKQDMIVAVEFHKKGKGYYKIVRSRKTKQGNNVKFYYNAKEKVFEDIHEISLDSSKNTNKLIVDTIDITSEMFSRMVVVSASQPSFLNMSIANQASFIERLFDLHLLADKATVLKTIIKSTEDQTKELLTKIDRIKQEQNRLDIQINNAKSKAETFEQNKLTQIDSYKSQLVSLESIDVDKERAILDESSAIKDELKETKHQKEILNSQYNKFTELKKKHEKELLSLKSSKCPYCAQFYQNDDKIEENEEIIKDCETNINEMLDYIGDVTNEITEKSSRHSELIEQLSVRNLDELIGIKNKADNIKNSIEDWINRSNVYLEQLAELQQIELEPCDHESVDKLKNTIEHQQFLLKLLSKKDSFIRKQLLSSNLKYLNMRLEKYLNELSLPYHVEFNSNMTADIKYLGRKLTFANLSHGQRSRVNIGLTLAFRDVRQKMSSPVNICCMDEILDTALDSSILVLAAKLLKKKANEDNITMYVVTHREEIMNMFDNTMTITMENDFSKISYV